MNNFVENFYLADTKKCALLKEKVMDFLLENDTEALKKLSSQKVPQSQNMLTDFLTASARKRKRKREHDEDSRYEEDGEDKDAYEEGECNLELFTTMSIDAMRKSLDRIGMCVDGTREMLIDSLENGTKEVVVEGAGTPEVNGIYKRIGAHWGASKYKKSAQYKGEDVEFMLYRLGRVSRGKNKSWHISIWPEEDGDIDFYKTTEDSDDSIPPLDKWVVSDDSTATPCEGVGPAPTLYFKAVCSKCPSQH